MAHSQLRLVESIKNAIKNLFITYGETDYIGESITQLDHAIQAGLLALNDKRSHHVVLAAFLHDIGHLVGLSNPETTHMIEPNHNLHLGIQKHEELGAEFLTTLGFPKSIIIPISNHVLAKRYLLTIDDSYREEVSAASLQTFVLQGGLLTLEERQEFEASPYFDESILLRYYDDMAKVPNLYDNETKQMEFTKLIDLVDLIFQSV
jgi:predicted HD phosphohydrolase